MEDSITTIILKNDGSINEIKFNSKSLEKEKDIIKKMKLLSKIKLKKGSDKFNHLHSYEKESYDISLFGFKKGKEKIINKHDLPPPIDNELFFGDILMIKHKSNEFKDYKNFTDKDYEIWYESQFGGFIDLGSDDTSSGSNSYNSSDDEDYVPHKNNEEDDDESVKSNHCDSEEEFNFNETETEDDDDEIEYDEESDNTPELEKELK